MERHDEVQQQKHAADARKAAPAAALIRGTAEGANVVIAAAAGTAAAAG